MATYADMMQSASDYQQAAARDYERARAAADRIAKPVSNLDRLYAESDYAFYSKRANQYYILQKRYRECSM